MISRLLLSLTVVTCFGAATGANATMTYHLTDLAPVPGGVGSVAGGVNDAGQVIGVSSPPGNAARHVILWDTASQTVTDLGAPGGYNQFFGINNAGQAVGFTNSYNYTTGILSYHAMLWDTANHTTTDLGTLGGTSAYAFGINDAGQAVGYSDISDDAGQHATLWDTTNHTVADLGTLSGTDSWAYDINGSGQVVGASLTTDDAAEHATLWDTANHKITDLGTLGGTYSTARAINDAGQAVGCSKTADGSEDATLWDTMTHTMTDLEPLGYSHAYGINDAGQVVGDLNGHATLWDGNSVIDLNDVLDPSGNGWTLFQAEAINDSGQIVGDGWNGSGREHGFLLTPDPAGTTPLPASLPLFASGLGGLGLLRWRRRKKAGKAAA